MNVRDTIQELTRIGVEIRRNLQSSPDRKGQVELVLAHIKEFSKKASRIADFQTGLEWFNVSKELSIYRHLNGKIIILDFFTYCCINCMHILPDLSILEKQFSIADGLIVIGVHSAKFSNERDSKSLSSAIQRHNITHPVVNDASLTTWRNLGISCWPTLVMIGPTGELLAVFVGEGHRDELILFTDVALTYFKSSNKISESDIPLQLARHLLPVTGNGSLLFPSKVEVFQREEKESLIVSDTGNNRILITDTKGNVKHVVGGSNPGFKDGDFKSAKFNAPQGVCILDDSIYVADNENHSIRKIDLNTRTVTTVAGTGIQGDDYIGGKNGTDQALSSPWDVAVYKHQHGESSTVPVLLIAVAGTHQIWALFLKDTTWWKNREYQAGTCIAIVGSGREENRNNAYPHAAGLAQPSGLTVVQEKRTAFFADSESSAVRSVDLQSGRVSVVCGANRDPADLHDYGDCDGARYAAKLQHPLGIAWHSEENVLYVADTYNHKVKKVDVTTGHCKTIYGDGRPDETFSFNEPSGIAVSPKKDLIYLADTNNHAVKVIDTRKESITTLQINVPTIDVGGGSKNVYLFDTTISENGGELAILFRVTFLEHDLKLNLSAPQKWSVDESSVSNAGWITTATSGALSDPVRIKIPKGNGIREMRSRGKVDNLERDGVDSSRPNTAETKHANGETVRATESTRSPASIGVNLYRLPPSPANLLKPDGFQFYTYNERGDMITRQMTMQEIQALIAGGGPGHSNAETQGPQKVEDILTGGKKVIDVVEKVQSVLKSAMDKPLSTLSGSHLTIPEKANVEWSNILPAILAGDKYGNKMEDNHHVEEVTLKSISTSVLRNGSFSDSKEGNVSETVTSAVFEDVTKHTVQIEETTAQTEKDRTYAVPSSAMSATTTGSFTEKLMIPVAVITTESNTERVTQHTATQSYNLHKITEGIPPFENVLDDHYNQGAEEPTNPTTISEPHTLSVESTENINTNNNTLFLDEAPSGIDSQPLEAERKPTIDTLIEEDGNVSPKTQPTSLLESNNEPPRTTGTGSSGTTLAAESSTIGHDTATNLSDTVSTQNLKPLSTELINSLSSVIGQVADKDVPSVLPVSAEVESTLTGNDKGKDNNASEIVPSEIRATTLSPSNYHEDGGPMKANDTFGDGFQHSLAGNDFKINQQHSSTTSPVSHFTIKAATNDSESWTKSVTDLSSQSETTTTRSALGIVMSTLNPLETSDTNFTAIKFSSSKPVDIINNILRTVSTDAVSMVTESVTIPNKVLSEGFSSNTLASALIAGFAGSGLNKAQIAYNDATASSSGELDSIDRTDITDTMNQSHSVTKNENRYNSTAKEDLFDNLSQSTNYPEHVSIIGTTDRTVYVTRTNIEFLQSQSESVTSEPTTPTSSSSDDLIRESLVSSNKAQTNISTESIDERDEAAVNWPTVSAVSDINPILDGNSLQVSQKNDDKFPAHLNGSTEVSSTHNSSTSTTIIATVNFSESEHKVLDDSSNLTGAIMAEDTNVTMSKLRGNETIQSPDDMFSQSNGTKPTVSVDAWLATINVPKTSTENGADESVTNRINTKETSGDNGTITSTTYASNVDVPGNKTQETIESHENNVDTNGSMGAQVLGGSYESQVEQKLDEREKITPQRKANSTDIVPNTHPVWQRIPLHQTTPILPTGLATTTTEPEISVPTTVTLESNSSKMHMHSQSSPVTEKGTTVTLDASKSTGGLDTSTRNASIDIINFSRLCNELAIKFWVAANKGLSTARSLALSPFGMISLLAMIFLGARGPTSDQMNEVLGLDNVATFNPHLVFQNVTDTVSLARHQGIANAAFVRELFADKAKVRKLLPFYKEQAQQFYEGLVAEVNFATISDLVRRRTNLLVRKQTGGRIKDFVKSNAVSLRSPLAAISANVFQTDCNTSSTSTTGRDGELYFAVSSAHRLRKLIPVPATVWRSSVLAGYEPSLDATAIALGGVDRLVSTIFLLPGQQGHVAPGDTLDRLEQRLVKGAFRDGIWNKLLKVLIPRPGLDVQIPKFSHRSVVNATAALKRMGLDQLFSNHADFKGINGIGNRLFLSDVLQMNLFSTCGDENIANGRHHVEVYPAGSTLRNSRNSEHDHLWGNEEVTLDKETRNADFGSKHYRADRRREATRNVRKAEEKPRLKLDQPFLYFVRHNPTGLILHMGRFNPRLL